MKKIDVSKCKHIAQIFSTQMHYCKVKEFFCENITDCYYKQLQELKQENEKLKSIIEETLDNAGVECDDEEQANRTLPKVGTLCHQSLLKLEKIKYTCNFDIEHQGYATPTINDILQIIEGKNKRRTDK